MQGHRRYGRIGFLALCVLAGPVLGVSATRRHHRPNGSTVRWNCWVDRSGYRATNSSIFAAQIKSFSDKPPIACVVYRTRQCL